MAEASRDQASVSTTVDPEEDSPNMIVYRKVRPTLHHTTKKLLLFFLPLFSPPAGGTTVALRGLLIRPPSLSMRVYLTRGPISVEGNHPRGDSRLGRAAADIL